ncbi:alpha/beta hydrolase [Oscillochloris sp. ZM17-4]|uniref:alpha/beta fold hydrolase n=1 Tax=Oscillochloris sp. ZM17-4 TaxID=2866714 RepID=UPI001C73AFB3|nr:alpha/beta hydrolase [Oscillochloris sp. ZM17-4]MBX0328590.1 alpha/beta hydrolase [Oscillochloris sp. ZM17-4]
MNTRIRRFLKILGVIALLLVGVVALGPFLIPVTPLEGLESAQAVAPEASAFVSIPFAGTDGIAIHYRTAGAAAREPAPTFVLLHGSLFNAFTWDAVLDVFAARGRVIAYDQIPYGLSEKLIAGDWTGDNPYTPAAAVDQLIALLDALEVDQAVLVGNSYGGTLAVQAALAHPERVTGLILIDAAVYVQEEVPAWVLDLPQVRHLGPLFARELGQSEAFIRQTYRDPTQISAEHMDRALIHRRVANWDLALWEYLQVWGIGGADYVGRIPTIDRPALVLSGDSDTIVPVADSERLAVELPHANLVVLAACGHVPQEECPDAFETAVDAWLNAHDW